MRRQTHEQYATLLVPQLNSFFGDRRPATGDQRLRTGGERRWKAADFGSAGFPNDKDGLSEYCEKGQAMKIDWIAHYHGGEQHNKYEVRVNRVQIRAGGIPLETRLGKTNVCAAGCLTVLDLASDPCDPR